MSDIFDKDILDQMYDYRKEEFEQTIYDEKDEIKEIEGEVCELGDELLSCIEKFITNNKVYDKVFNIIRKYELAFGKEIDFWERAYYKLGINDMNKLKHELNCNNKNITKGKTFLDYTDAELDEYVQSHVDFNSEAYRKFKAKYDEIEKNYPRVLEVFEESTSIVLNQEEMEKLMEIKVLDMDIRAEEAKRSFKLGMNEILNF